MSHMLSTDAPRVAGPGPVRRLARVLGRPSLALTAALAALVSATAPAPARAEIQNPNTHYVKREGSTMRITDVLWYAAYAGAHANSMGVRALHGHYACKIDGRNAQLLISSQYLFNGASEACYAGPAGCSYSGGQRKDAVEFKDHGWNNDRNAPWVRMLDASIDVLPSVGNTFRLRHPNSPQSWELEITAMQQIVPPSDNRSRRIGLFGSMFFVTEMVGHTVWEGKRYPLSCSRADMTTLRDTVLRRWAP